jgi:hypothetical protein
MTAEKLAELMQAYKTITSIMEQEDFKTDASFRRVQAWLSNKLCDELTVEDIKHIDYE